MVIDLDKNDGIDRPGDEDRLQQFRVQLTGRAVNFVETEILPFLEDDPDTAKDRWYAEAPRFAIALLNALSNGIELAHYLESGEDDDE